MAVLAGWIYSKDQDPSSSYLISRDGGKTWTLAMTGPFGPAFCLGNPLKPKNPMGGF